MFTLLLSQTSFERSGDIFILGDQIYLDDGEEIIDSAVLFDGELDDLRWSKMCEQELDK